MPSDPPHTPSSPSRSSFGNSDLASKPVSPRPTHSLPTPAHSINGSMSSIPDPVLDTMIIDEITNKRKREVEDNGDRDQKKVHVEDSSLSIEDLHVDVGEKYLLCKTRKTPFLQDQPIAAGFVSFWGLWSSCVVCFANSLLT